MTGRMQLDGSHRGFFQIVSMSGTLQWFWYWFCLISYVCSFCCWNSVRPCILAKGCADPTQAFQ